MTFGDCGLDQNAFCIKILNEANWKLTGKLIGLFTAYSEQNTSEIDPRR